VEALPLNHRWPMRGTGGAELQCQGTEEVEARRGRRRRRGVAGSRQGHFDLGEALEFGKRIENARLKRPRLVSCYALSPLAAEQSKTLSLPNRPSLSNYGSCCRGGRSSVGRRIDASHPPGPYERPPRRRPPPFRDALVRRHLLLFPCLPPPSLPLPPQASTTCRRPYAEVPRDCQVQSEDPGGVGAQGPLARLPFAPPGR
jgi:hypothetical protein